MAASKTAPTPVRVELSATNYSLGALDFATPTLCTPVTPLQVQNYSLGPLAFGPSWRPGRIVVSLNPIGRPPDILDAAKPGMIEALVAQLSPWQAAKPSKRLVQDDKRVKDFVLALAENAGIDTSWDTLKTQIVRPAFHRWRFGD